MWKEFPVGMRSLYILLKTSFGTKLKVKQKKIMLEIKQKIEHSGKWNTFWKIKHEKI